MREELMTLELSEFGGGVPDCWVTLTRDPDGMFTLAWHDGVVNDWVETYTSLSPALARLALLTACSELGWDHGFVRDPDDHETQWKNFVAENVG